MTKQQIRERFAEYGNVSSVVVSIMHVLPPFSSSPPL